MLRRASCTALSTERSRWLEAGKRNGNKSLVRTSLQAQRVWDGPGQRDGWMQAMERKSFEAPLVTYNAEESQPINEVKFLGRMVNRTGSSLSGNKVGLVLPQSYKMQLSLEKWISIWEREQLECRLKGNLRGLLLPGKKGSRLERKREGSGEME